MSSALDVQLLNPGTSGGSTVREASHVISDQKCNLLFLLAKNGSAGKRYIQLHNASELPDDGAVPLISFPVLSGDSNTVQWEAPYGFRFSNGCVAVGSTTEDILTIGASDFWFTWAVK